MNELTAPAPHKVQSPTLWFLVVFITGIITRLLVILFYQPVAYSDTPSYRRLAEAVLRGFEKYDGTRTPGYPAFLALAGSDQNVWLAQLFLGLATTLLLFYIGWKLTGKTWFGGLVGLLHTLNLGQLFFESSLLTESLTTFLLVLSLAGMLVWYFYSQYRNIWLAFSIGLISTLTLLVRPLFIYLPFYMLLFLLITRKTALAPDRSGEENSEEEYADTVIKPHPWRLGAAFLLPVVLLLGGWVMFIHTNYGDWSLTTMTGYHLIQHTGSYFEYVPDEYAALRDTYIRYRDVQITKYGTQTNTIWEAIPEMSQASGYNFYDLSRVLAKISIQLILKHPLLFLQNAAQGWWMFWRTSVYWSPESLRVPWLAGGISSLILIQRAVLFLANLVFILASLFLGVIQGYRTITGSPGRRSLAFDMPAQRVYFWFLAGVIWIASILQTLLDHGDNPRFLVPLQSLVLLWVGWLFTLLAQNKRAFFRGGSKTV